MLNNDEQIEEYEMSFYTLISEEEDNNKLKKNEVKGKNNLMFVIPFCRDYQRLSPYNLYSANSPPLLMNR